MHFAERLFRRSGREASLCSQILRASPDCAQELGSAGLDRSVQGHRPRIMAQRRTGLARKILLFGGQGQAVDEAAKGILIDGHGARH